MAEARSRKSQVAVAAGGAVEVGDEAADVGRAASAAVLRTPAAQIGLQVTHDADDPPPPLPTYLFL